MKKLNVFLILLLAVLCIACDDVFEEDISDDEVFPFFPLEGDVVSGNSVNFQWDFLEDVDSYRIQVLSADGNTGIVLDSLVTTTSLRVNIPSGEYSWSASGENFAFSTPFFDPINFSVEFSDDLSNQSVQLLTPSDNFITNTLPIIYTWTPLEAAESYTFGLQRVLNGTTTVLDENTGINVSIEPAADNYEEDAEYIWSVQAINENSTSQPVQRSLLLDRTVPEIPTLLSPVQSELFDTDTILFSWTLPTDTGNIQSARSSVIQFSQSASFDVIIATETLSAASTTTTFELTGELFWRVRVDDAAGNSSAFSEVRSFTIN